MPFSGLDPFDDLRVSVLSHRPWVVTRVLKYVLSLFFFSLFQNVSLVVYECQNGSIITRRAVESHTIRDAKYHGEKSHPQKADIRLS